VLTSSSTRRADQEVGSPARLRPRPGGPWRSAPADGRHRRSGVASLPGMPPSPAEPLVAAPLGAGLINHSYRLDTPAGAFVLQRINGAVFPAPERIMDNLSALAAAAGEHPELGARPSRIST